jgi:hypothetical protein
VQHERNFPIAPDEVAVEFKKFGDHDVKLFHQLGRCGCFRDQAGHVIAGGDENLGSNIKPRHVHR